MTLLHNRQGVIAGVHRDDEVQLRRDEQALAAPSRCRWPRTTPEACRDSGYRCTIGSRSLGDLRSSPRASSRASPTRRARCGGRSRCRRRARAGRPLACRAAAGAGPTPHAALQCDPLSIRSGRNPAARTARGGHSRAAFHPYPWQSGGRARRARRRSKPILSRARRRWDVRGCSGSDRGRR